MLAVYVAVAAAAINLAAPPTRLAVTIAGSLEASIVRAEPALGPALAAEVARLLRWRGRIMRDVHRGDRLVALVAARSDGGEPDLLALDYRGLALQLRAYRFPDADGVARYYDAAGTLVEPAMCAPPVPRYSQITDTTQRRRGRAQRRHNGIDLKADSGSAVVLPFDGTVTRTNWSRRINGRCVEVRLTDGRLARFLHLDSVAEGVSRGTLLAAGAPLGTVGTTGRSNAPHLHYELWRGSRVLEPLEVHGRAVGRLAAERLAAFAVARAALDRGLGLPPGAAEADAAVPPTAAPGVPSVADAARGVGPARLEAALPATGLGVPAAPSAPPGPRLLWPPAGPG